MPLPVLGQTPDPSKIRIGVSSCLLGEEVRYNGGHKRDLFLTGTLGAFVEFVPVCPEVEIGMGTPRPPIRLERTVEGEIRLVMPSTGEDLTERMRSYAGRRVGELAALELDGYVLKKDSPSCGMERVKVFGADGSPERKGRGIFAEALIARFPTLPVEEEGRLSDPSLRENFIERVFAFQRLRTLFDGRWTNARLVRFHTAHKMSLLSHSTSAYTVLGQLVAGIGRMPRALVREEYERTFMRAMTIVATPRRHTNVLTHMAGHLKTRLDAASKRELLTCIDEYRRGLVPLVVPLTLLRHYVRAHGIEYLAGQTYLEPHPRELMLRNRV